MLFEDLLYSLNTPGCLWAEFNLPKVQISKAVVLLDLIRFPECICISEFRAVPLMKGKKEGMWSKNFQQFSKAGQALDPRRCRFFLRIQWKCSSRNDLWVELVVLTKATFRQLKAFMQLFCSGVVLEKLFFLALFLCCPRFDRLLIANKQGEAQPNNSLNLRRNSLTILGLCLSDTK